MFLWLLLTAFVFIPAGSTFVWCSSLWAWDLVENGHKDQEWALEDGSPSGSAWVMGVLMGFGAMCIYPLIFTAWVMKRIGPTPKRIKTKIYQERIKELERQVGI